MTIFTQSDDEMVYKVNLLKLISEIHHSLTVILKNTTPEMVCREKVDLAFCHRRALAHSRLLEVGVDLREIYTYGSKYRYLGSRGEGYGLKTVMFTSPEAHFYTKAFAKPGTKQALPVAQWPEEGQAPTLWHGMIADPFARKIGSLYINLADLANQGGHVICRLPQAIIHEPFPDIHKFGISLEKGLAGYLYLLRFTQVNIPCVDDENRMPNVIRAIVGQLSITCNKRSQSCVIHLKSKFVSAIDELLKGHAGVLLQLLITRHNPLLTSFLIRSVLYISRAVRHTPTMVEIILMVRASEFSCHDTRRIRRMKTAIHFRLQYYCPPVVVPDSVTYDGDLYTAFTNLYLYKAFKNIVYAFNAAKISKNILNRLLRMEASEGIPSEMEISLMISVLNWRHFCGIPLIDDF